MNKIAFTNINNFFLNDDWNSFYERILETPDNSGNFLFFEGLKNIAKSEGVNLKSIESEDFYAAKDLKKGAFFFVFANLISNQEFYDNDSDNAASLERYLDLADKYPAFPLMVFSIGCQNKDTSIFKISDRMKSAIDRLINRSSFIGLRGLYTANVLHANNIHSPKFHVLGCPSIFAKQNLDLTNMRQVDFNSSIGLTLPAHGLGNLQVQQSIDSLIVHSEVFIQEGQALINFSSGRSFNMVELAGRFGNELPSVLKRADNFHYFHNPSDWLEFLTRKVDLCFGSRIHGVICSVLAGIPTLCAAIDSRTLELCQTMHIPYVDCVNNVDVTKSFGYQYVDNLERFICFFNENLKFDADLFLLRRELAFNAYRYGVRTAFI